ncbi:protein STRUBBELIG-RECEPTOR FAMILY 6-like [Coffea eugenioides]|uniref:protein STRUBBELIG-RECEPTOR FAMILY 6-like n=1 Tax=Coffea eugenioides TaxID=49369 RepID=UPI000F6135FF|nr:protein STRUBBELIG-RECEPTOR FAMILY 6-like isoform X1 [Coffea eugenioides]XP_027167320.1 protein STRUBBELIG-RECEPTOR FAMILY 6-like isoform X1 [Coffea eugenioides]XP_027167859.1 protein STRUBBELIG-RECEPTOR FAMILY 6-like [Coffea eugenioides]XP_027167860.1 protein STRUBBELIG-RECEPTOR FAMILY 6-like [Coffea eugenioides]
MREVELAAAVALLGCILLLGPSFTNADTDPNDAGVLFDLYKSLNSPSQLTKWNPNFGDPCKENWKGITCSGSRVTEIKLSGLGLTGSMGFELDKLKSVSNFDISNNNLGNQLPFQLPQNVQQLNLAGNGFNGGLPYSVSQMTSLKYLNVSHNQFQGQLGDMFASLTSLSTLDFSFNVMSGDLPKSFSSCTSMTDMNLQNNQFTGTIDVLANLPLDNLNVENNHFSGWIPDQLKDINLQTGGNSWTSGPAPPPPPGTPPASRPNKNHKSGGNSKSDGGSSGSNSGISGGAVAGIVISILVVGAIVAFFIVKRRSRRPSKDIEKLDNQPFDPLVSHEVQEMKSIQPSSTTSTISFETPTSINLKPPPVDRNKSFDEDDTSMKPIIPPKKAVTTPIEAKQYSVADLQMATDSFSVENLIGEGSIGRVYRAEFDDGKVLAVKKIKSSVLPHAEDFLEIVAEISRLHHPNVTELVGYCSEHGQHLLVYEFHKNGSLNELLHLSDEYSKPLTWNSRVKIALGTARALEYLHEVCSPSVIHKNFKSANILLDMELNPHLSDCGLASLVHDIDQALNQNAGSGYGAPEVSMSGQYTIKSDVYSFGVVMLELLTGRQPFDSSRARSEQSLVRWATPQLHDIDALAKMVDPALKGLYPVKSLSRFADVIALCVQPEPEFRPPMSEVVQALVRLVQRANMSRRTLGNDQGSSVRSNNSDDQD